MDKLLTVSVAAYNAEDTLAEALRSCLVPHMDLMEVIIVDDGSNDSTADVAESFVKSYPDIFTLIKKVNGGHGSTINASLERATGKYFRLLDADDWFDKDGLESWVTSLAEIDSDLLITAYTEVNDSDGSENCRDLYPDLPDGFCSLNEFCQGIHAMHAYTYRTSLLKDINLNISEHSFYVDNEFALLPIPSVNKVHVSHCSVYRYRLGIAGQSVSMNGRRRHCDDAIRVCKKLIAFSKDVDFHDHPHEVFFQRALRNLAAFTYESILMLPINKNSYHKAYTFDCFMRDESPASVYSGREYRKSIQLFKKSPRLFYVICACIVQRKSC